MKNLKEDRDFQLLEKSFPRVARNVELFWGTDMFCDYIDIVCKDTREGERRGFPPEAFEVLIKLKNTHMRLYPQFVKPWKPSDWFVFR